MRKRGAPRSSGLRPERSEIAAGLKAPERFCGVGGLRTASRRVRSVTAEARSRWLRGSLERSEDEGPRPTEWDWVLSESQRKRRADKE